MNINSKIRFKDMILTSKTSKMKMNNKKSKN